MWYLVCLEEGGLLFSRSLLLVTKADPYPTSIGVYHNLSANLDLFVLTEHTCRAVARTECVLTISLYVSEDAAARLWTAVRLQSSDQVPRTEKSRKHLQYGEILKV